MMKSRWHLRRLCVAAVGMLLGAVTKLGAADPTAEEYVRAFVEQLPRLQSFKASTAMRIIDRKQKFTLGVNAGIYAQAPMYLRLTASKLQGTIQAFDISIQNDRIQFYVPRQKILYQGTLSELRNYKMAFYPDEIVSHLLEPEEELLHKKWVYADLSSETDSEVKKNSIVIDEVHEEGVEWIRLLFQRKSGSLFSKGKGGCLTTLQRISPEGTVVFEKTYKKYKKIDEQRNGGELRIFPYWIKLQWPIDEKSIAIAFKKIEGNAEIPEDTFEIEIEDPDKIQVKELGEATLEGDEPQAVESDRELDTEPEE